jgi:uncharacterized membrane protein
VTNQNSELQRTEAFSDGVFAIAITLLALELKTPMNGEEPLHHGLLNALAHQWPAYMSFMTSFLTVLVTWINHHRMFEVIKKRDNTFQFLNGVLLMTITLLPFATVLVSEYILQPDARIAVTVLNGIYLAMALAFNAMWRYASRSERLFTDESDRNTAAHITAQFRFGPALYLANLLIGLIAPLPSFIINFAFAAYYAIPPKERRGAEG